MAVSMLCFSFLVAFVAINHSFADPHSDNIPELNVNNGYSTLNRELGANFTVSCTAVDKDKTGYEPRWQMKSDSPGISQNAPLPSYLAGIGWYKATMLEFKHFEAENAGIWNCDLWSLTKNKVVQTKNVTLVVQGPASWEVQFQDNQTEYWIKTGESITWTIVIRTSEPSMNVNFVWYWPSSEEIDSTLIHVNETSTGPQMIKRMSTLNNVTVGGLYKVIVSKNNRKSKSNMEYKTLVADVSLTDDVPTPTPMSTAAENTTSPSPSSGIRIESSFLVLVVAWFACRSAAFGSTARIC